MPVYLLQKRYKNKISDETTKLFTLSEKKVQKVLEHAKVKLVEKKLWKPFPVDNEVSKETRNQGNGGVGVGKISRGRIIQSPDRKKAGDVKTLKRKECQLVLRPRRLPRNSYPGCQVNRAMTSRGSAWIPGQYSL